MAQQAVAENSATVADAKLSEVKKSIAQEEKQSQPRMNALRDPSQAPGAGAGGAGGP